MIESSDNERLSIFAECRTLVMKAILGVVTVNAKECEVFHQVRNFCTRASKEYVIDVFSDDLRLGTAEKISHSFAGKDCTTRLYPTLSDCHSNTAIMHGKWVILEGKVLEK